MELKSVRLEIPEGVNLILGQSHFIKTVEDIYEAIVNTNPAAKFGIAFNEASGACLTRVDGNDDSLKDLAAYNAGVVAAGCDVALHCSGKMDEMVAVASAVPAMSAEGHDRLGRAMAGTRLDLEGIDFAEEIAKRDQLLALV